MEKKLLRINTWMRKRYELGLMYNKQTLKTAILSPICACLHFSNSPIHLFHFNNSPSDPLDPVPLIVVSIFYII